MRFKYQRVNDGILSHEEVNTIIDLIDKNEGNCGFGIRNFLSDNFEVLVCLRESNRLIDLVQENFDNPKIIKSIYFDKPKKSNWTVNWHQDLTINLTKKLELENYINWRVLPNRVVVQPALDVLNSIMTYRIHLDDTDESNGALKIIRHSEDSGVRRISQKLVDQASDSMEVCRVQRGGVMMMNPLTIHASHRSKDNKRRRRVIHLDVIEASRAPELPWWENYTLK